MQVTRIIKQFYRNLNEFQIGHPPNNEIEITRRDYNARNKEYLHSRTPIIIKVKTHQLLVSQLSIEERNNINNLCQLHKSQIGASISGAVPAQKKTETAINHKPIPTNFRPGDSVTRTSYEILGQLYGRSSLPRWFEMEVSLNDRSAQGERAKLRNSLGKLPWIGMDRFGRIDELGRRVVSVSLCVVDNTCGTSE